MKPNQLVIMETEGQGCLLFRWNKAAANFDKVGAGVYGREGSRFCCLGESETNFAVWFISSWGDLCKTPDHCDAVESYQDKDDGLFYCLHGDWYFRSYNLDWEMRLGQKLISKAFYYTQNPKGEIVLNVLVNGEVKTAVYTEMEIQEKFELHPYDMEDQGIFLKKASGSFDIIGNNGKWFEKTVFKKYIGEDRFCLYLRREDGSYDFKGVFSYLEDWDNAVLTRDETGKKIQLFGFDENGLKLVCEGVAASLKREYNILSQTSGFWLGTKHFDVIFQFCRDHREIKFISWKTVRERRWVRLIKYLKKLLKP